MFFGTYNWSKETPGIHVYEVKKGKLKKQSSFTGVMNPSFLTLSPDGRFLYACIESKTPGAGGVAAFEVDSVSARLRFINARSSGGENPVYLQVHPEGKWLANANYTQGSLSVYPLAADGRIGDFVQNLHFEEGSINPKRQEKSHVHAAVFSPDGRFLLAPDLGADKVRIYPFDASANKPLLEDRARPLLTPPGTGPRHLSFHPSGAYVYCVEELGGAVEVYAYDRGQMKLLQRILLHDGADSRDKESSDIHLSPDGKFLYAANRGRDNNLVLFSVGNDGTLVKEGYIPTQGDHPRTFAVDDVHLAVAHPVSGEVSLFVRRPGDGKLKRVGKRLKIPGVSTVHIRTYKP